MGAKWPTTNSSGDATYSFSRHPDLSGGVENPVEDDGEWFKLKLARDMVGLIWPPPALADDDPLSLPTSLSLNRRRLFMSSAAAAATEIIVSVEEGIASMRRGRWRRSILYVRDNLCSKAACSIRLLQFSSFHFNFPKILRPGSLGKGCICTPISLQFVQPTEEQAPMAFSNGNVQKIFEIF